MKKAVKLGETQEALQVAVKPKVIDKYVHVPGDRPRKVRYSLSV